jgi:hypothetical protein
MLQGKRMQRKGRDGTDFDSRPQLMQGQENSGEKYARRDITNDNVVDLHAQVYMVKNCSRKRRRRSCDIAVPRGGRKQTGRKWNQVGGMRRRNGTNRYQKISPPTNHSTRARVYGASVLWSAKGSACGGIKRAVQNFHFYLGLAKLTLRVLRG